MYIIYFPRWLITPVIIKEKKLSTKIENELKKLDRSRERLYEDRKYGSSSRDTEIDTLESAYEKIVAGRTSEIRTFHSDIYYIQHLINYKFGTDYSAKEINELLYQEGLLKWSEYVPQKYVRKMESIKFKHVPATRPDYNQ